MAEQPPASQLTKDCRKLISGWDRCLDQRRVEELCDNLDASEARIRAMYVGDLSPESRLSGYKVIVDELRQQIDASEASRKELVEAFIKYGNHRQDCNLLSPIPCVKRNGKEVGCDCGFYKAESIIEKAKK